MKFLVISILIILLASPAHTKTVFGTKFNCNNSESKVIFCDTGIEDDLFLQNVALESYNYNQSLFGFRPSNVLHLYVLPNRDTLDSFLQKAYKKTTYKTHEWMVGLLVDHETIVILSPTSWKNDAPVHYPVKNTNISGLLKHEMIHAFHEFYLMNNRISLKREKMMWFVEGLAYHFAKQVKEKHYKRIKEDIKIEYGPQNLNQLWQGSLRYAKSASMIDLIVNHYKINARDLLSVTSNKQILNLVKTQEKGLIGEWEHYILNKAEEKKSINYQNILNDFL